MNYKLHVFFLTYFAKNKLFNELFIKIMIIILKPIIFFKFYQGWFCIEGFMKHAHGAKHVKRRKLYYKTQRIIKRKWYVFGFVLFFAQKNENFIFGLFISQAWKKAA